MIVRIPPAPLVSILENLLSNSCEALMEQVTTDAGSRSDELRISVSTCFDAQGVEIRVEDNGPGMPFCRKCGGGNCLYCPEVGIGQTTKDYGSGIGLTSIRRHSEKHEIPVWLSNLSTSGVRTSITITITITSERVISCGEFHIAVDG